MAVSITEEKIILEFPINKYPNLSIEAIEKEVEHNLKKLSAINTKNTTIQLSETTFDLLNDIKNKEKLKSYDEIILKLIKESKKPEKSHFGSLPELDEFKREELYRLIQ